MHCSSAAPDQQSKPEIADKLQERPAQNIGRCNPGEAVSTSTAARGREGFMTGKSAKGLQSQLVTAAHITEMQDVLDKHLIPK